MPLYAILDNAGGFLVNLFLWDGLPGYNLPAGTSAVLASTVDFSTLPAAPADYIPPPPSDDTLVFQLVGSPPKFVVLDTAGGWLVNIIVAGLGNWLPPAGTTVVPIENVDFDTLPPKP